MNNERSVLMRMSYESLFATAKDAEIIVIDNGGSEDDTKWLVEQNIQHQMALYIRNRKNMHFWYARNQGLKLCSGDYIVIADNDIHYSPGWMEECVEFLEKHPGKYLATPIKCDVMNTKAARWKGELDGWKLNQRAGSNVFMMRRKDFEAIGYFDQHRIAGSKYVDTYVRMGYLMAIMPTPKALDLGFRRGYNLNTELTNTTL